MRKIKENCFLSLKMCPTGAFGGILSEFCHVGIAKPRFPLNLFFLGLYLNYILKFSMQLLLTYRHEMRQGSCAIERVHRRDKNSYRHGNVYFVQKASPGEGDAFDLLY